MNKFMLCLGILMLSNIQAISAENLKIRTPSVEQYRSDSLKDPISFKVSVINEGETPIKIVPSLKSKYGDVSVDVSPDTLDRNSVTTLSVTLGKISTPYGVRPLDPPNISSKFSGTLILRGTSQPASGDPTVSDVAAIPITLLTPASAIFNRPWLPGIGAVIALVFILFMIRRLFYRKKNPSIRFSDKMMEAPFDASKSWVSNLTLFAALITALLSQLVLSPINKLMYGSMIALFASLVPLAPLIYKMTLTNVFRSPPKKPAVRTSANKIILNQPQEPKERIAIGPVWGYLLASLVTLIANLGTIGVLILLANHLADDLGSAGLSIFPAKLFIAFIVLVTAVALYSTWLLIFDTIRDSRREYLRSKNIDPPYDTQERSRSTRSLP